MLQERMSVDIHENVRDASTVNLQIETSFTDSRAGRLLVTTKVEYCNCRLTGLFTTTQLNKPHYLRYHSYYAFYCTERCA